MKQISMIMGSTLAALGLFVTLWYYEGTVQPTMAYRTGHSHMLILDAGHGGEDGGAISLSGRKESDINLEIVRRLDDLLGLLGENPVLLRRTDVSLAGKEAVTLREKKRSDLKNRVEVVCNTPGAALLSVHQNTFPGESVCGFQAFYAPTEDSEELAHMIQTAVRETLQKENWRETRRIPETVYLMNHISCPAVLVECGFLTNPTEERELLSPEYQKKLAAVLACGYLSWERE